MTPWDAFLDAVVTDPAAPRVTFYERTPGLNQGERIELSGKVLLNWVSKAANMLTEEFDVEPGTSIFIDLPIRHWRSVYWFLAAWACGATIEFRDADTSTASPAAGTAAAAASDLRIGTGGDVDLLVTLPALARAATDGVPPGVVDEAQELATFADQYTPLSTVPNELLALPELTYGELAALDPAERAYLKDPTPERIFAGLLGSGVMLVRGPVTEKELLPLLQQEALRAG